MWAMPEISVACSTKVLMPNAPVCVLLSGLPTMAPTPLPIVTTVHSRHKWVGPSRYVVNSNDDLQARTCHLMLTCIFH